MRTLSRTLLTAALVSLSFAPLAAHAGNLTGDTILGNFESINTGSTTPFIFSSGTTTVPGAAIIAGNGYLNSQYIGQGTGVPILTWQFTANELIFSFLQTSYFDSTGLSFNGPVFTDQTNTFNTNVALNSGASTPALAALASQATVVGNTLSFNFEGLNFQSGQTLVYNVNNNATAVTPEPSGLLLLGTGVLGTAGIVRRRILA